jgi:hypothetical protein
LRSHGSRGLGRHPVNYSRGLRRETPPIKPCGRLRRLRFAFSMHDVVVVCVWAAAEPVSSSVHAPRVAWPLLRPRPPSPSCLVGLDGVDVVGVGVAWVRSAGTSRRPAASSGCARGMPRRSKCWWRSASVQNRRAPTSRYNQRGRHLVSVRRRVHGCRPRQERRLTGS